MFFYIMVLLWAKERISAGLSPKQACEVDTEGSVTSTLFLTKSAAKIGRTTITLGVTHLGVKSLLRRSKIELNRHGYSVQSLLAGMSH